MLDQLLNHLAGTRERLGWDFEVEVLAIVKVVHTGRIRPILTVTAYRAS
jgi:hypothetical protein